MKQLFNMKAADRRIGILLIGWWIINIIQAAFTGLANDEAYYWLFAQKLSWGYFDHPPMTPLLIWLGNFVGGELGIRLLTTLLQPLYLYILWRLIRPAEAKVADANLFVVICAAMPVLQLYGFIAVPDAPLMMFTALFLVAFKRFSEKESWCNVLFMGLSMALLAYSKYQGALVVLFALLANPRLLRNPKLYVSGAVTLLLFMPHLMWQYNHDWESFRYHLSGRNGYFHWNYIAEFWLNIFAIFNPFFFPLYFKGWGKEGYNGSVALRRALYTITAGFVIFFTISALRGYVQPQWVIPIAFGLVAILFGYVHEREKLRCYTMRFGLITITLVAVVRIVMIFNIFGIRYEVFDNRQSYGAIAQVAQGRPVIFGGNYSTAAKYIYYTGGDAFCQPSINYRTSQWHSMDNDTRAAGRQVIVECQPENATDSIKLANGRDFMWSAIDDFRPVRNISVTPAPTDMPATVEAGESLSLHLTIENPYDYAVEISPDKLPLVFVWGRNKQIFHEYSTEVSVTLPAKSSVECNVECRVPDLEKGKWRVGFIIKYDNVGYWFAGDEYELRVVEQ